MSVCLYAVSSDGIFNSVCSEPFARAKVAGAGGAAATAVFFSDPLFSALDVQPAQNNAAAAMVIIMALVFIFLCLKSLYIAGFPRRQLRGIPILQMLFPA